jgi:hypothetical protein
MLSDIPGGLSAAQLRTFLHQHGRKIVTVFAEPHLRTVADVGSYRPSRCRYGCQRFNPVSISDHSKCDHFFFLVRFAALLVTGLPIAEALPSTVPLGDPSPLHASQPTAAS